MTTPPPAPEQPQPATGDQREDQAAISGAEAAAILAAAEVTIIGAVAASVAAVVAGSLTVSAARRRVRAVISAALGKASGQLRQVYARAAVNATAGGHEAGRSPGVPRGTGEPGQPGQRAPHREAAWRGHGTAGRRTLRAPELPDAPKQIEQEILNAQHDAGQAFDAAMHAALGGKGGPLPPSNPYRDAVDKAMRRLTGIGQDVKDLTGAERAAQSLSRLQAAQVVMDDLASRGITGFVDSAGRRWSLDAYAEMATRTAASRLHLSTQLAMMAQAGNDLVIVDNPAKSAPCPLCRPFEGKVLSLSGRNTGEATITDASGVRRTEEIKASLAEAVAAGLLHPQCRHSLIPWTDGAGAVATAGGQERGYVVNGRPVSEPLPVGTPQQYKDEQKLRAHERNVRAASMRVSAAVTPQARARARAHLAHARAGLEAHVKATGVTRLRGREKAGRAR